MKQVVAATLPSSQLNAAQHVKRIREIIMGRDLNQVNGRLERIENRHRSSAPASSSSEITDLKKAHSALQEECQQLRLELHQEKILRQQQHAQIAQTLNQLGQIPADPPAPARGVNTEDLASEMAARIDARFREILSHIQTELLQWKGQLDRDVQAIREVKADRKELSHRLSRIAAATMEDPPAPVPEVGFLL